MKPNKIEFVIGGVTMELTPSTIDEVEADFVRENPLRLPESMSSEEFADRMMKKLMDSAFKTPKGSA